MAAPASPKFDVKMIAMPVMMLLSRKIDFKDENIVQMAQIGLATITAIVFGLHFLVYSQINAKKSTKKVWVPPKAKPSLPFGLGPAPEPIKAEEFEETTFTDYEVKLLKDSAQAILMSIGIAFFMSLQFKIHMSLAMQCVMVPLTAFDSVVLKKYLLGTKTGADGSSAIYGELEAPPTAEYLAKLNAAAAPAADAAIETTTTADATPAPAGKECRVEELSEEDKDKKVDTKNNKKEKSKSTSAAAVASSSSSKKTAPATPTTPANELD
jgi:hypothetical protein